jgi:hypothetical protein
MPLNAKGREIMANMVKQYGEKKAKEVFYASVNAGKITDVEGDDEGGLHKAMPMLLLFRPPGSRVKQAA